MFVPAAPALSPDRRGASIAAGLVLLGFGISGLALDGSCSGADRISATGACRFIYQTAAPGAALGRRWHSDYGRAVLLAPAGRAQASPPARRADRSPGAASAPCFALACPRCSMLSWLAYGGVHAPPRCLPLFCLRPAVDKL